MRAVTVPPHGPETGSSARWWFGGADLALGASLGALAALLWRGWPPHAAFWFLAPCGAFMLAAGAMWLAAPRRARIPALVASWSCLGAALVSVLTLLISAGHLRAVYGGLGPGLAVAALILAVLAADVLVLVPVLQLRWLMRGMPLGRRGWLMVGAIAALLLGLVLGNLTRLRPVAAGSGGADAARRIAALLRGEPGTPPDGGGALRVTVFSEGKVVSRFEARGAFVETIRKAAEALPDDVDLLPLRVDVAGSETRLPRWASWLAPFLVREGLDGLLGRGAGGTEARLWPDDLAAEGLNIMFSPLAGLDRYAKGFSAGIDIGRARERLAATLGGSVEELARFPADSVVAYPGSQPTALEANRPPGPPPTREAVKGALQAGIEFLARRQRPGGTFDYMIEYATDSTIPRGRTGYSMGRHSSVTWFLADACAAGFETACPIAAKAHRAIPTRDCGGMPCLVNDTRPSVPLSALALLAAGERGGASATVLPFVRAAQRPDGGFWHRYDRQEKRFVDPSLDLFVDGEAALGLARSGAAENAARAIDFSVGRTLGPLTGLFFVGEHSVCIAASALPPHLSRRSHATFCRDYARFHSAVQYRSGDPVPRSFHGGYGLTPMFPPQLTPTATRTHAIVAALQLCRRHGLDCEDLRDDVVAAVGYLLRAQLRPEDSFRLKNPAAVLGAFPERDGWLLVRPDYVSYAGRALLAAYDLLPG